MKGINILQFSIFFVAIIASCTDEEKPEVVEVSPYSWKESNLSPGGLFTYARFETGDDGNLYASGTSSDGHVGFYKFPGSIGNNWTKVGEANVDALNTLHGFAFYQGSIYYHLSNATLYKLEDTETKEILTGSVADIEICQDELAIIGGSIKVSNDSYTMVSFDGTSFKPLVKDWTLSRLIRANGKVYWPGFPSVVYDGKSLTLLNFYGDFVAVDEEEQMYYTNTYNNRLYLSRTPNYGQKEELGDHIIGLGDIFRDFEFFDGTIFLVGVDTFRGYSKVYFLKDDKWIEVPTEQVIYDVIVYNNKLITSSVDGKFYELVKD